MKKLLITVFALAILAGVFVCPEASADTRPWNVAVTVEYEGGVYRYDLSEQITGLDEQAQQRGFFSGARAKRQLYDRLIAMQLPSEAVYNYILPHFDEFVAHFAYVERPRIDAEVHFDKSGFRYAKGQDGVTIDRERLFAEMLSRCGTPSTVTLPLVIDRAVTVEQLRRNTVERGSFSTSFERSGANRAHNIARAAESLNGVTVGVGETFSFNEVVGERTEARGYKLSKVIMDGNYTDGVGGGVCQVSTTLYNALLLANIIPRASQHSLVSSYVKAGFDAMVSYGNADLTFTNTTEHPLYISAWVRGKTVGFTVYGEPNPYRIVRESVEVRDKFATTYIVDADKYPELVYIDQTRVIVSGSDGVRTKSYLKYYLDGKLTDTRLIRTNSYKRVDAVIARGYLQRDAEG